MTDIALLEARLRQAFEALQRLATYNGPYGARTSAEQKYGEAYQALVRVGARPQVRAKYRRQ